MIKGIDTLAAALYWKLIIKVVPRHIAISVLFRSFDRGKQTGWKAVHKLAKAGFRHIKVVSVWKDSHVFTQTDVHTAKEDAKELVLLALKYPNVTFSFVPFLEHRRDGVWITKAFRDIREILGGDILMVNSPVNGGGENVQMPGTINERHHTAFVPGKFVGPLGYAFSHDGEDALNTNLQKTKDKYSDARYYWIWVPQCNLKRYLTESISRPSRNRKTMYKALLKALVYVSEVDKGEAHLSGLYTWKAFAEQHSATPGMLSRDNKPVFLSPVKYKRVKAGKVKLSPTGRLDDGRWVYRTRKWGWKIHKKQGNVVIKADGKTLGVINTAYRENEYK